VDYALIRAYNPKATDAKIVAPVSKNTINNKTAGFVEDTFTLVII
jgi:hypothetical protein